MGFRFKERAKDTIYLELTLKHKKKLLNISSNNALLIHIHIFIHIFIHVIIEVIIIVIDVDIQIYRQKSIEK